MPKIAPALEAFDFSERLKEAMRRAGANAGRGAGAELARRHQVSTVTANAWLNGSHKPEPERVQLMAADYRVPYEWLYFGKGSPDVTTVAESPAVYGQSAAPGGLRPIRTWDTVDDLPADEYVVVPRLQLRFSAGNGGPVAEADPHLDQGQAFRTAYIRRKRLKPKGLMSAYAVGDSMEPRICDGDALLIDTAQREVQDGKVYAMVWGDEELKVKRLYKLPGGGLLIRSDNRDHYPEITVPAEQVHAVSILGRVVLVSGDV